MAAHPRLTSPQQCPPLTRHAVGSQHRGVPRRPIETLWQHWAGLIATAHSRERLRLTKPFLAVLRRGAWSRGPVASVGILPNHLRVNRLGLRIRKAAGNAVARNRTKRLLREAYQRHKQRLTIGHDIVVVLHRTAGVSLRQLERELLTLCQRAGLLKHVS